MGAEELRREPAVRRIWESATASVMGGLIVWWVTSLISRPAPMAEGTTIAAVQPATTSNSPTVFGLTSIEAPASPATPALSIPVQSPATLECPPLIPPPPTIAAEVAAPAVDATLSNPAQPAATSNGPPPTTPTTIEAPTSPVALTLSIPASAPASKVVIPRPKASPAPHALTAGPILLYENFSRCREGDAAGWGPNTFVKTGLDRRNWLVSNVDGTHPVGCRIRLPGKFYFQCRYAAYLPEVTRGVLGWWKEPVASKISFLTDQRTKYVIEWVGKCGKRHDAA